MIVTVVPPSAVESEPDANSVVLASRDPYASTIESGTKTGSVLPGATLVTEPAPAIFADTASIFRVNRVSGSAALGFAAWNVANACW